MFELLPWNCIFFVCLFVCLFLLLLFFFHFQPSVVVCVCFFLYKFCCQFLSTQFFLWVCFFVCAVFDLSRHFILAHFTDFRRSLTGFVFCLFFQFCSLQWTKISCLLLCIFLLVHLLLPPAPTSLTMDPRVFSFSSIAAAEKRARSPWWWCCLTYSLPQLSRVNSPVSN